MTATRRRGFTMLELIIVIVILGILAAIAIVGYRAVIDNTRWASIEQTAHTVGREAAALAAFGTEDDPLGVALSDLPEDVEREQVSATVAEIAQDGRCVRIETLDDGQYELTRICATALGDPGDNEDGQPGDGDVNPGDEPAGPVQIANSASYLSFTYALGGMCCTHLWANPVATGQLDGMVDGDNVEIASATASGATQDVFPSTTSISIGGFSGVLQNGSLQATADLTVTHTITPPIPGLPEQVITWNASDVPVTLSRSPDRWNLSISGVSIDPQGGGGHTLSGVLLSFPDA